MANVLELLSVLDWFATFAPEPTKEAIAHEMNMDKARNPHNDTHKPKRRSEGEIIAQLKYNYAEYMVNMRYSNYQRSK